MIAVLDDNSGQLEYFSDTLSDFNPRVFDSLAEFLPDFKDQYSVIVLAHRFNGISWKKIYDELKSGALFVVVSTHPLGEYRDEYPGLFRDLTTEIAKHRNVLYKQKWDEEGIYRLIDAKISEKSICNTLREITHKAYANAEFL